MGMSVKEFVDKYMNGQATIQQEDAIRVFLGMQRCSLWVGGKGCGKTTLRKAFVQYLSDQEKKESDGYRRFAERIRN